MYIHVHSSGRLPAPLASASICSTGSLSLVNKNSLGCLFCLLLATDAAGWSYLHAESSIWRFGPRRIRCNVGGACIIFVTALPCRQTRPRVSSTWPQRSGKCALNDNKSGQKKAESSGTWSPTMWSSLMTGNRCLLSNSGGCDAMKREGYITESWSSITRLCRWFQMIWKTNCFQFPLEISWLWRRGLRQKAAAWCYRNTLYMTNHCFQTADNNPHSRVVLSQCFQPGSSRTKVQVCDETAVGFTSKRHCELFPKTSRLRVVWRDDWNCFHRHPQKNVSYLSTHLPATGLITQG